MYRKNFFIPILSLLALCLSTWACDAPTTGESTSNLISIPDPQSENFKPVKLEEITLPRKAITLNADDRKKLPHAHTGFKWDDGDNETDKWRPQGIAGLQTNDGRKFLAVSWYGRAESESPTCPEPDCSKLGARISFVDVTDMRNVTYRHVLLMKKDKETGEYLTFGEKLHAGGLVYRHGKFYVPNDQGTNKIHIFSIDSIKKVSNVTATTEGPAYGYTYVMIEESSVDVDIAPSFLSYDWDRDMMLVGSFEECFTGVFSWCHSDDKNKIAWYFINDKLGPPEIHFPIFTEMQGAASMQHPIYSDKRVLWVSSSFGRGNESYLRMVEYNKKDPEGLEVALSKGDYTEEKYIAGLEDIHLSSSKKNLWTLTEFTPEENGNDRVVFAMKTDSFFETFISPINP